MSAYGAVDHSLWPQSLPGRCILPIKGCKQPLAINYHQSANTDDGSCLLAGCTDSTRPNYEPQATVYNGMCAPLFPGCTDSAASNYHPLFNAAGGKSCSIGGCMDSLDGAYEAAATFQDGTCAVRRRRLDLVRGGRGRRLSGGCMDPTSGVWLKPSNQLTHNQLTHNQLTHNQLAHNQRTGTRCSAPPPHVASR